QGDEHALDAGDLVQHRADEDLHVAAAGSLRHPALADYGSRVAARPAAGERQSRGEGRPGCLELRPHQLDGSAQPFLSRLAAPVVAGCHGYDSIARTSTSAQGSDPGTRGASNPG